MLLERASDEQVVAFFNRLYADVEPEKGWCLEVRGIDLAGKRRSSSQWFGVEGGRYDAIIRYARRVNGDGFDTFFQVNPTPQGCQSDDDVLAGIALWADIDGMSSLEATEAALSRMLDLPLKPDAAVFTGGGLHVYHFLKEPYDPAHTDWSLYLRALRSTAEQYGGDKKCVNPARVLRFPGSVSHKRGTETLLWLR